MVTYYALKMTKIRLPMIGHLCATNIVISHLIKRGSIDPSKQCWKVLEIVASHLKFILFFSFISEGFK